MKLNIAITSLLLFACFAETHAKDFYENFCDSTLRIDYIFGGGPDGVRIMLDSQTKQKGWAGRRHRLQEVPAEGNGTIMVTDPVSGDTLYRNSFSSLFQEWINTPEARDRNMAFENSFLVPLPKSDADITVSLRDNRHEEIGRSTYRFRRNDELVALRGNNPLSYTSLHKGGDSSDAIDIAILAEGYAADEMDSFLTKANDIATEILSYEPFAASKEKFNILAVMTPSRESGVSIPIENEWRDTAFESHFSTFYSSRYLTVPRVWKMHRALEGIPYEHVLVVVNTPRYGGGGIFNSYQVATSDHEFTLPVAVHEFGHSFAGLADEYFYPEEEDDTYPLDIEPWEQNITTMVDFDSKWKDMLGNGENSHGAASGIFEGGGYKSKGIYRPADTCRMRDNHNPDFCAVCRRAIRRVIEFYTGR